MSSEITFDGGGFEDFEEMLKQYSENVSSDKALDAVEAGAKEFVNDLLRLPKPRSQITKAGYTHIVSTFALERTDSVCVPYNSTSFSNLKFKNEMPSPA